MDFLHGKKILHKNELVLADVALKKKNLILYYFTSGESEPCRAFDGKLKEVYEEAVNRKAELAVVVVSAAADYETFEDDVKYNYHDFYAIPFSEQLRHVLVLNFGITSIPCIVVVRKNGTLVTKTGKKEIETIGKNVLLTWSE